MNGVGVSDLSTFGVKMDRKAPLNESRERDQLIRQAHARVSELEELIAWGEELIGRYRESAARAEGEAAARKGLGSPETPLTA